MSKRKGSRAFVALPMVGNVEPEKPTLPYNGSVVADTGFSFSFACFDHSHKLFNLGDNLP